jgi:hypothetical protein
MLEPWGFIILLVLLYTGVLGAVLSPFISFTLGTLSALFKLG